MEHYGLWGIIPPVLTIVLAFVTKDVLVSLFLGILSGTLIVAQGNPIVALMNLTDILSNSLADGWNIRIFLFCGLLGGLVGLMSKTGATGAFGKWASGKLKTTKGSQLMVFIFGLLIFIDDYFNSLTVGTVMRPISDKTKTSRAKLAYILDSTAAPVCILAPISSWVVTVMSLARGSEGFDKLGISELQFFISSIPFNIYAILTLIMVVYVSLSGRDFGPMAESEKLAKTGVLFNEEKYGVTSGDIVEIEVERARPMDMLFPIIVLIISAVTFFPATTWFMAVDGETVTSFTQAMSQIPLGEAFNNTDASVALMYAMIVTLFITYIYYLARRLVNLQSAGEALRTGIASMIPALITLAMAWSIGTIIKSSPADGGLGLGKFLSGVVINGGFPVAFIPAIVFVLSAIISFATGTSWGTFGIMIPIVMPIATSVSGDNMMNCVFICLAAVLSGAVFGDHASPISDTTVLSSTGACCPHMEHISTQIPYAAFIAVCSFIGFFVGGLLMNAVFAWVAAIAVFLVGCIVLPKIMEVK